jgi:DNA (cytosine-5)-methyltransferase 1
MSGHPEQGADSVRLLDLFCGAGGAGMGYHLAGFEVVGVDIDPQPNYPFEFVQADAMTFPLDGFDAIHASPPCQHYAPVTRWRGRAEDHPDLLQATVERLKENGRPWVVENVPYAPISPDFVLCGSAFGLKVRRHRWFLTSWSGFALMPSCRHEGLLPFMHKGADAMGCQWMTNREAREAIPPAYTDWIGRELLAHIDGLGGA